MARSATRIVMIEHLTLDGVYQAPARADEDRRGDFEHGGWSARADDPALQEIVGAQMKEGWALLAGRRTYEDLYEGWQVRQPASPMAKALTSVQKFVVTRDPDYDPRWQNSTLLAGEGRVSVSALKAQIDKPLIVFGAGELVRSLIRDGLVDELIVMLHPLLVGQGLRLFDDTLPFTELELADSLVTSTGVIVATYRLP